MSAAQIMADVMVAYPNTRPMCSANVDGAAAAVLVSGGERLQVAAPRAAAARGQDHGVGAHLRPVAGVVQVLPDVSTLTKVAARKAYESAGVGAAT